MEDEIRRVRFRQPGDPCFGIRAAKGLDQRRREDDVSAGGEPHDEDRAGRFWERDPGHASSVVDLLPAEPDSTRYRAHTGTGSVVVSCL